MATWLIVKQQGYSKHDTDRPVASVQLLGDSGLGLGDALVRNTYESGPRAGHDPKLYGFATWADAIADAEAYIQTIDDGPASEVDAAVTAERAARKAAEVDADTLRKELAVDVAKIAELEAELAKLKGAGAAEVAVDPGGVKSG